MFGNVVDWRSFSCFCAQAFLNESKSAGAFAWHNELTLGDLLDQTIVVAALKRHGSVDERVEENPEWPAVDLGTEVGKAVDDFGRGVEWRATERVQERVWRPVVAKTKIGKLLNTEMSIRITYKKKWLVLFLRDLIIRF